MVVGHAGKRLDGSGTPKERRSPSRPAWSALGPDGAARGDQCTFSKTLAEGTRRAGRAVVENVGRHLHRAAGPQGVLQTDDRFQLFTPGGIAAPGRIGVPPGNASNGPKFSTFPGRSECARWS